MKDTMHDSHNNQDPSTLLARLSAHATVATGERKSNHQVKQAIVRAYLRDWPTYTTEDLMALVKELFPQKQEECE